MFKNEVTHTISCREASSVMGSSSSAFVYVLRVGSASLRSPPSSDAHVVLPVTSPQLA